MNKDGDGHQILCYLEVIGVPQPHLKDGFAHSFDSTVLILYVLNKVLEEPHPLLYLLPSLISPWFHLNTDTQKGYYKTVT